MIIKVKHIDTGQLVSEPTQYQESTMTGLKQYQQDFHCNHQNANTGGDPEDIYCPDCDDKLLTDESREALACMDKPNSEAWLYYHGDTDGHLQEEI